MTRTLSSPRGLACTLFIAIQIGFSQAATASALISGIAGVDDSDLGSQQTRIIETLKLAMPATVGIEVKGDLGSGVIVSADGLVLTAAHVISNPSQEARIFLPDGSRLRATTLGVNEHRDSGMLKIRNPPKDLPWCPLAALGTPLEQGDWCVALGHPGGFNRRRNPVARIGRLLVPSGQFLKTDCPINMGDSGGPLFNLNGEVIGIHSRIEPGVDSNYHVPYNTFHNGWNRFLAGEKFSRSSTRLGIRTARHRRHGAKVQGVQQDSPADRAGLVPGDIITAIDSIEVRHSRDLALYESDYEPNSHIVVDFVRDSKEHRTEVVLDGELHSRSKD